MSDEFDVNQFLDATTTEALVRLPPLPVGNYIARIDELKGDKWASKDGTKKGSKFNVTLKVDPMTGPARDVTDASWPTEYTVNDSIMLDVTESGALDYGTGKNGRLRIYRDATQTNVAGQQWSPRQLVGRQVLVQLQHREYQGEFFNDVKAVAKVS